MSYKEQMRYGVKLRDGRADFVKYKFTVLNKFAGRGEQGITYRKSYAIVEMPVMVRPNGSYRYLDGEKQHHMLPMNWELYAWK